MGRRDKLGDWDEHMHTMIDSQQIGNQQIDNQKDILYSTEDSTQYSVMTYWERNLKKKRVDICITDSLSCIAETNITSEINCT